MEGDFFVDYSKLDDIQRQFIQAKFDQNMMIIGKAGTGKSLIALHKLSFVPEGKTATVVVYTKVLQKYFKKGIEALGLRKNIRICYKDGGYPAHSDYMFVDECQDFTKEEVNELILRGTISYFFGDNDQAIMVFPNRTPQTIGITCMALGVKPIELFKNYRLTIQNAKFAEYVIKKDDIAKRCFRIGEKPILFSAPNYKGQIQTMIDIIKGQRLTRVGILLPYNSIQDANRSYDGIGYLSVEYVRDYMIKHGMPVEYKIHGESTLDFGTDLPKLVSWHCSKGLQFNDVFIPFCEYNYYEYRRNQIYVIVTRAYSRLHIGYTSDINTNFYPPISSEYYTIPSATTKI